MTYQETLDYMFAQLPMYHRIGAAAYKADIQPTINMMAALGNPERKFKSIHVAGTNGKGSVSHFLASILQEAGYKVGLYTSPHLVDFRERIRINGEMIPQEEVVRFHTSFLVEHSSLNLSFFEMTVGLAFDYFARQKVDVAVVEVGMGGRLDSTNVINPLLSVITNIGLDHTQFLGDTLEKIAAEKAGIIKQGVPLVVGETQPETATVFLRVAEEHRAPITFADQHYVVDDISRYTTELTGEYQKKNIATVLEAVEVMRRNSMFDIPTKALVDGLARVVTNTHLHGRWQKIGDEPLTICETAHNEPGIRAMIQGVSNTPHKNLHLVYGCVNDKDYRHILAYLNSSLLASHPTLTWYFSQPSVPRGLPVGELVEAALSIGINGSGYISVKEAIAAARKAAGKDDLVLVTGSIFLIADALSE
ncbi:MAG: bifunctional folylpolyglutamate synthase/dihydrofolate synthase [Bacteroidales bacterium]|nr:bifunctional folylpolyglutamate synthase/dihydrofolate synthase [Bacteroidales bacterium]